MLRVFDHSRSPCRASLGNRVHSCIRSSTEFVSARTADKLARVVSFIHGVRARTSRDGLRFRFSTAIVNGPLNGSTTRAFLGERGVNHAAHSTSLYAR
jgi:hypothetical protein